MNQNNSENRSRRGTITVMVLACMAVVTSLCMSMLMSANRSRHETKLRHQMLQTERFLDAAVARAARKSRNDSEYRSETWTTELEFFGRKLPATVQIEIDESMTINVSATLGIFPNITTQSYHFQLSPNDET
ncbi:hypothetical protein [Rhodopirellula sp. MGV]|uniref:hypothetical protein n=1 Tax=Rhodopirellula sp. MGV TaxID=2023130 RepID=UPI000B96C708|nr:hypothetical protein [Rhodopirellula sp. MGV]OYP31016.1 hypothetical protein CGZ80_21815 [Rhodopirellula sp. MGV]PNY34636.1 hypothetical protein C2E31_21890 [Rhodopirellula baltica]